MTHENLWAPWRAVYLRGLTHKADNPAAADVGSANFLASYFNSPQDDAQNLIVYRNPHGIVLLNRYPYATGHLMAALGDPRPTLLDYTQPQRAELWKLVEIAMDLVQHALHPQGINMGINQGRAAGAGLPEHLHAHIVPRWAGDTNFITVVGEVRVIPESLEEMAKLYRSAKI